MCNVNHGKTKQAPRFLLNSVKERKMFHAETVGLAFSVAMCCSR